MRLSQPKKKVFWATIIIATVSLVTFIVSLFMPQVANIAIIGREFVLVQQLPPYYVFSRKKMRDELLNGGLPGTDGTLTETGWGEKEIYSSNSIC